MPTIPAAASRAARWVTTSQMFTTSFRTFRGTSGIPRTSLKVLATLDKSGDSSSCIEAIKGVLKAKVSRRLEETGPNMSDSCDILNITRLTISPRYIPDIIFSKP
uniref:Uncharacterized protein n=1 Tax=Opuntia streptacantha TaxID=393608 RepID=A0A7C9CN44_OPUST